MYHSAEQIISKISMISGIYEHCNNGAKIVFAPIDRRIFELPFGIPPYLRRRLKVFLTDLSARF